MVQCSQYLSFALKPGKMIRIVYERRRNRLDGDVAAELCVVRSKHNSHPAYGPIFVPTIRDIGLFFVPEQVILKAQKRRPRVPTYKVLIAGKVDDADTSGKAGV